MKIETERLLIRELEEKDESDYFEIFGNPAISKYDDFTPIKETEAEQNIKDIIEAYKTESSEKEYGVELKSEKKIIGVLYLNLENGSWFTGYHFNEKYHGKGYAAEAVSAFLNDLGKRSAREIRAIVDPENRPSIKLLEKLSFELMEQKSREKEGKVIHECFYRKKPVNS